ncbi:MAG: hypothetical protein V2B19_20310 [Pseudomonadota bacterium]
MKKEIKQLSSIMVLLVLLSPYLADKAHGAIDLSGMGLAPRSWRHSA